jgi:hypothetical protein
MATNNLRSSPFARSLSDVLSDMSDLVRKELQLARAEVSAKVATKVQAGAWMGVAGLLGLVAMLLVVQALVFGIASFGIALHWSCLIVAGFIAAVAGIAYLRGRSDLREDMSPHRTIHQVKQDIAAVKEQWSS